MFVFNFADSFLSRSPDERCIDYKFAIICAAVEISVYNVRVCVFEWGVFLSHFLTRDFSFCLLEFVRSLFSNVYSAKTLLLFRRRKVVCVCVCVCAGLCKRFAYVEIIASAKNDEDDDCDERRKRRSRNTHGTERQIKSGAERVRENERKYFLVKNVFWMRCKFGKLMMWIKEMQKCDRYEAREKRSGESVRRELATRYSIILSDLWMCVCVFGCCLRCCKPLSKNALLLCSRRVMRAADLHVSTV